jgi:hypothetical protein
VTLPKLAVANSGYGGRGYKNPVTGDKRVVPSITTVLKAENKPALVQWAVDQTAGYAVANAHELLSKSEDYGFKMLRWYYRKEAPVEGAGLDLNSYYNGVRDDAADMGTAIHEWIQADLDSRLPYPDLSNQGDPFWQMVDEWEKWKKGKDIEAVFTERTVWNDELGYAGTFDGVWTVDGQYGLMDIKSSRGLYSSTWMQLAALHAAPVMFDPQDDDTYTALHNWQLPTQGMNVLHIRPKDWDNKGNAMAAFCKWVPVPNPAQHFEAFKGLLTYQHAMRALRLLEREQEKDGA